MPSRIVIIDGHPDPDPERLCHSLATAYAEGARAAGHTVQRVEIASLDIPFLATQHEFETAPVPPSLQDSADAIVAADHLVIIFPLWLGTMPARLKAFLEQVARPGVAFRYRKAGMPEMLFKGKTARIVVTMGMPAVVYRIWFRSHGLKVLERNILRFVGVSPVRTTIIGSVGTLDEAKVMRLRTRMDGLGRASV